MKSIGGIDTLVLSSVEALNDVTASGLIEMVRKTTQLKKLNVSGTKMTS